MDMDPVRMEKKKPPHTEYEKQLLIQLVNPLITVLDNRKTDSFSIKTKQKAWDKLTEKFNSSPNISHRVTPKQLKKMWQNLKTKANKTHSEPHRGAETQELSVTPKIMSTVFVDSDSDTHKEDRDGDGDSDSNTEWLYRNSKPNIVTKVEIVSAPSSPPPVTDTTTGHTPVNGHSQEPNSNDKKRKGRNVDKSIDIIRKKIYFKELQQMTERFQFEKQLMLEKHEKEMEILEIKKQIALKELNK